MYITKEACFSIMAILDRTWVEEWCGFGLESRSSVTLAYCKKQVKRVGL